MLSKDERLKNIVFQNLGKDAFKAFEADVSHETVAAVPGDR
jgi:hypothetical protein